MPVLATLGAAHRDDAWNERHSRNTVHHPFRRGGSVLDRNPNLTNPELVEDVSARG
jgi:hypothetical protein